MKHVMIRYTLRDDASIDAVKAAATTFVDGLAAHSDAILYTSYQQGDAGRSFVHVGFFPDEATLKGAQAQPFFGEFAAALKDRAAEGPTVTWLSPVASTHLGT